MIKVVLSHKLWKKKSSISFSEIKLLLSADQVSWKSEGAVRFCVDLAWNDPVQTLTIS